MAAQTISSKITITTDAEFRVVGKGISDMMLAGGFRLIYTNINWATVLVPTNGYAGLEFWGSNDSTADLSEYAVGIYYGRHGTTNAFALNVTAGYGIGAQWFTGFNANHISGSPNSTVVFHNCYISAGKEDGKAWVSMAMFTGSAFGSYFGIERTRNDENQFQNELLFAVCRTANAGLYSQIINRDTGVYPAELSPIAQALVDPATSIQGGKIGYSYQSGQKGGLVNFSTNVLGQNPINVGQVGSVTSIPLYGLARPYMICIDSPLFYYSNVSNLKLHILSRYEV